MATPAEEKDIQVPEGMTTTENGAISYPSTMDAGVDLFFKTVRGIDEAGLVGYLEAAWAESPEVALRIIFQTRDCRGGKGEKLIFYQSLKWLHANHPEIVVKNLECIPFFGCWKDLLALCTHCPELEERIVGMFVDQLKNDKNVLETKEFNGGKLENNAISLCAKWAPTENHSFDMKQTLAKKIAERLCGASQTMKLYRKEYLVPLRTHLRVTERYMCANEWNNIPYSSVPSRCMFRNKQSFAKHDEGRFQEYLMDVARGKAKIQGKQMYPHELVRPLMRGKKDLVIECQWEALMDDIKSQGSLAKAIVLSDVSGSMSGTPMEVAIALGLVISEVSSGPFHNMIITFESNPRFHKVTGANLAERVQCVARAPWGGSTDFQKALQLVLDMAVENNVPQEEMPDKLFVISDMQFNQADRNYSTNHEAVTKKFQAAGYEPPMLIYWNVRPNTTDFPALSDTPNVALLAGYSPSLLKVVMDGCDLDGEEVVEMDVDGVEVVKKVELTPRDILIKALSDDRYDILKL